MSEATLHSVEAVVAAGFCGDHPFAIRAVSHTYYSLETGICRGDLEKNKVTN